MKRPAGFMIAWDPGFTVHAVVLAAGLLIVTTLDSLISCGRLRELGVAMPDVVRLTVDHEAWLPLQISKPQSLAVRLRVGLALLGLPAPPARPGQRAVVALRGVPRAPRELVAPSPSARRTTRKPYRAD